jgi:hypothetical protein
MHSALISQALLKTSHAGHLLTQALNQLALCIGLRALSLMLAQ